MHALELKVPPVALAIAVALAMWLVSVFVPELNFPLPFRLILAIIVVAVGAGVALSGIVSFARSKTTVNPLNPEATTTLVESGVYRFSRNPMYLGFLFVLLGWAVFLGNALAVLMLPGFILYMNRFQIIPEEKALFGHFGNAFSAYSKRVRRWL